MMIRSSSVPAAPRLLVNRCHTLSSTAGILPCNTGTCFWMYLRMPPGWKISLGGGLLVVVAARLLLILAAVVGSGRFLVGRGFWLGSLGILVVAAGLGAFAGHGSALHRRRVPGGAGEVVSPASAGEGEACGPPALWLNLASLASVASMSAVSRCWAFWV